MGTTLVLSVEPGENGRHTAGKVLETILTFLEKAGFTEDDVVKVTFFEDGYDIGKFYYDISLQFANEDTEEPDYEIVRVKVYEPGGWKIEPISYNPPKFNISGVSKPKHDLRADWGFQVDLLLRALHHLYSYRAETLGQLANDSRAETVGLRRKVRRLKSKINDKSLLS